MTSTPTQITPATDAQISEWEYEAEQPHPNHQDWRILQLCARIKAEREQTIRACADSMNEYIAANRYDPRTARIFSMAKDVVLALLTNKGEQQA